MARYDRRLDGNVLPAADRNALVAQAEERFARRIREGRAALKLSQEGLATRLERTQACVSLWESGERTPTVGAIFELAHALEKPIDYFLVEGKSPSFADGGDL